jgi:general stress protein YciG
MPDNDKRGGSSNFANDPQKASEAGKKGGERSHGGQKQHEQTNKSRGPTNRVGPHHVER